MKIISAKDGTHIKTIPNETLFPWPDTCSWTELDGELYVAYNYCADDDDDDGIVMYVAKFNWETEELEILLKTGISVLAENGNDGVTELNAIHLRDGTPCLGIIDNGTVAAVSLFNVYTRQIMFNHTSNASFMGFNYNGTRMAVCTDDDVTMYDITSSTASQMWTWKAQFIPNDCYFLKHLFYWKCAGKVI